MLMTLFGRKVSECDPELRFLKDYAVSCVLYAPYTLPAAVLFVPILRYQNRKHDPSLGHQLMWPWYQLMSITTLGCRRNAALRNEYCPA